MAQDSWKLYVGKTEIASGKVDEQTETAVPLSQKSGQLLISYFEETPARDQTRHFAFFNEQGTELLAKSGGSRAKFDLDKIATLLEKYDSISIYSWSIPNDPDLAARVRVRRQLICKISKAAQ